MKTLFIIPLVLMSLVSFPSWGVAYDDLVYRAHLFYEKFSATPFTGELDEGLIRGSFKNGKPEGSWEEYWESGQLQLKTTYKNGKREGSWVRYFSTGALWGKGNYKNDNREGYWEWYNRDGSINKDRTGTFKNGVKVSD